MYILTPTLGDLSYDPWATVPEAPKTGLDPRTAASHAEAAAAAITPGSQSIPIRTLQRALAVQFGAAALARSCGAGECDGRWGPNTERALDRAYDLLGLTTEPFTVKGSAVLLPTQLARWAVTKAAEYVPRASSTNVPPPEALAPEEDYVSPRRRMSTSNVLLIAGGATAALGLGALGFVMWRKRKGRR